MEHRLGGSGEQKPLDAAVKILKGLVQEGVQKPSSRKAILEMKEQCKLQFPILLAFGKQPVGGWLLT